MSGVLLTGPQRLSQGGEGTTPVAPPEEALKPRAVGHSWCAFPALLDAGSGGSLQSSCTVHLKPYARIFDENGLRMAVDDPRHKEEAIASVSMTMEVHVDPEVIAERMEKMDSVEEGEE